MTEESKPMHISLERDTAPVFEYKGQSFAAVEYTSLGAYELAQLRKFGREMVKFEEVEDPTREEAKAYEALVTSAMRVICPSIPDAVAEAMPHGYQLEIVVGFGLASGILGPATMPGLSSGLITGNGRPRSARTSGGRRKNG